MRYIVLIFIISIGIFLSISNNSFAQLVITEQEVVNISAQVGSGIIITPPVNNPAGAVILPNTSVQFKGRAYPGAIVVLLRDGIEVSRVVANFDATFSITLPEEVDQSQNILYSLYAIDKNNNKSILLNFPTKIQGGFLTFLNNILFPPTIVSDKYEASSGGFLNLSGYAVPNRELEITIKDNNLKKNFYLTSKVDGNYNINLPLLEIPKGEYNVLINYKNDIRLSKFLRLILGNKDTLNTSENSNIPGDCNRDRVINLVDFSVAAFWYKKPNPPKCVDTNFDNIINLVDFSILAYYWNN